MIAGTEEEQVDGSCKSEKSEKEVCECAECGQKKETVLTYQGVLVGAGSILGLVVLIVVIVCVARHTCMMKQKVTGDVAMQPQDQEQEQEYAELHEQENKSYMNE